MKILNGAIVGELSSISELREKVKLAGELLGDLQIFVRGNFNNVAGTGIAFLQYDWTEVQAIGYKTIDLVVDGEKGKYTPDDPTFRVMIKGKD